MFEFDMFSPDIEQYRVTTETKNIGNHKAYSIENEYQPFVKLTAIIDLDKNYYLYFNYYGSHYGDEQNSRLAYVQDILKMLQIQDNHTETMQLIADNREQSLKDRLKTGKRSVPRKA